MKNFPAVCIDNFYHDPKKVSDWAKSLLFSEQEGGRYPGKRTKPLHQLNAKFFESFCARLFSVYYDYNIQKKLTWQVSTSFQVIPPYSEDPLSLKNSGWIHTDTDCVFAGIVYLNEDINPNCGTSIFKKKPDMIYDETQSKRLELYGEGIDNEYDDSLMKHNNTFEETIRFQNVYNRLVMFDAKEYHGVNTFYTSGEPRLTQVFFCYEMYAESLTPLDRMRNFTIGEDCWKQ